MQEEQQIDYHQELGLKKMLYKYQHQNEQLRTQIKALTQRLAQIVARKQQIQPQPTLEPADQYRLNMLRQQLRQLYNQIQKTNIEIKTNKDMINEAQQIKCTNIENQIKKEQEQILQWKHKIQKYEQIRQMKGSSTQTLSLKNSTVRIGAHEQKLKSLETQLDQIRRSIRSLEKQRNQYDRSEVKRHFQAVDLQQKAKKLTIKEPVKVQEQSKEKPPPGLWNMEYNQQNYNKIKTQLEQLTQQKEKIIESLRNQNIILKKKTADLSIQTQQLNKSIHLPHIEPPRSSNISRQISKSINNTPAKYPDQNTPPLPKMLNVAPKQFQLFNDKNYSPKKTRRIQWQSTKSGDTSGIQWNDGHLKSPIIGIDLWFDSGLIGVHFLHRLGESSQHLHLINKMVTPINYRLGNNDYLQNIILWISDNRIIAVDLLSKNGRFDQFGNRNKGRKFDFSISDPQKPVFSFGKFRITNNVSQITKLGFQVV